MLDSGGWPVHFIKTFANEVLDRERVLYLLQRYGSCTLKLQLFFAISIYGDYHCFNCGNVLK